MPSLRLLLWGIFQQLIAGEVLTAAHAAPPRLPVRTVDAPTNAKASGLPTEAHRAAGGTDREHAITRCDVRVRSTVYKHIPPMRMLDEFNLKLAMAAWVTMFAVSVQAQFAVTEAVEDTRA